jgi:hypothetical protein
MKSKNSPPFTVSFASPPKEYTNSYNQPSNTDSFTNPYN